MATNQLGIRNSNIIVPYTSSVKRTKHLDISSSVSVSVGIATTKTATAVFYADSNNNWRMHCTGNIVFNTDTDLSGNGAKYLTFAIGCNFGEITNASLQCMRSDFIVQAPFSKTTSGANTILIYGSGLGTLYLPFEVDVGLAAEPTTYTTSANMEGVLPVSVYIPPVSSGVAGIFPALNTELDNVTATRLGLKQYLHGTTYNGGNAPTVSGATVSSVSYGTFVPYQLHDATWRMKFNIELTSTASSNIQPSINGVTTVAYKQAISTHSDLGVSATLCYALASSSQIRMTHSTATSSITCFSGDIALASKPTWAY